MTQTIDVPAVISEAPAETSVQALEPEPVPRVTSSRTFDDRACLAGAFGAALAFSWLLYEQVLPFNGLIGFVVVLFCTFLAFYVGLTALSNPWPIIVDRFTATLIQGGAGLTAAALISAVAYPFIRGYHALLHWNFVSQDMGGVGPQDALTHGGVWHAMVGTLIEVAIAVAIALPLGVGAAIYMSEVGGWFARIVRTIVEAMTALPSIIAGLFIYTVLIVNLHIPKTGFTASMALAVMMLPIIARASVEVLRVVPGGLREASLALGSSRWRTVWNVVLPTVRPGLATALILGVARGVGETSPVLLTSGASTFFNTDPFNQPMNSLPLFTYTAVRSGEPVYIARGFGAACVLLLLVLTLFIIARIIARPRVR
jgi:phosphate transport system permease protein